MNMCNRIPRCISRNAVGYGQPFVQMPALCARSSDRVGIFPRPRKVTDLSCACV